MWFEDWFNWGNLKPEQSPWAEKVETSSIAHEALSCLAWDIQKDIFSENIDKNTPVGSLIDATVGKLELSSLYPLIEKNWSMLVFNENLIESILDTVLNHILVSDFEYYHLIYHNPKLAELDIWKLWIIHFQHSMTDRWSPEDLAYNAYKNGKPIPWNLAESIVRQKLLNELFGSIRNRWDVSSRDFLSRLELFTKFPGNGIETSDESDIIIQAFEIAFEKEFQLPSMKRKLQEYASIYWDIRESFISLGISLSDEWIDTLLAIPIIESNLDWDAVSEAWAVWYWQILPRTASGFTTWNIEPQLKDMQSSSMIAWRYLQRVIKDLTQRFPDLKEDEIIRLALTEYNGAWNTRLNEAARQDIVATSLNLYVELNVFQNIRDDSNKSEKEKLKEWREFVQNIQDKYFSTSRIAEHIHKYNNINDLYAWSKRYFDVIVKQQLMYSHQVQAAANVFQRRFLPDWVNA